MQAIIAHQFKELKSFLADSNYSKIFVLTDTNTRRDCFPIIKNLLQDPILIEIEAGEHHKNLYSCELIWSQLLQHRADRHALFINLGGGMIGDIGGFVASTYKRGIDFIHIPTSLLAMVDASTGGKTGIDFKNLKNIIGVFALPKLIHIYPPFLQTLAQRELLSGYAEMLKHGLIADKAYFEQLISDSNFNDRNWSSLIEQSILIKEKIVLQDPEEKGLRKILNFGHTIGHALETYFLADQKQQLLHGEAVAWGMLFEAWLSYQKVGLSAADLQQIKSVIIRHYQPFVWHEKMIDELIQIMYQDKKNEANEFRFTLLPKIGMAIQDIICNEVEIKEAFRSIHL
jgi:3-dehydroquinate synthase